MAIRFWKLTGAGNDFIGIDNMSGTLESRNLSTMIRHLCDRRFGIGSDGVLVLEQPQKKAAAHFRMRYFNADGSEAATCGNGARCAARLAHHLDIAPADMNFETLAGLYHATVTPDTVTVNLPSVGLPEKDIPVSSSVFDGMVDYNLVGVPHVTIYVDALEQIRVFDIGRSLRYHPRFEPPGINVNFIKVVDPHTIHIRTYERGVENETLACGTGSLASSISMVSRGLGSPPVNVITRSGITLSFDFSISAKGIDAIIMTGPADVVFAGQVDLEQLERITPPNPGNIR